ncbi:MAG: glucose-6-phosphate isomerase family protein [Candidatus Heimdallarchaeota archaeon]
MNKETSMIIEAGTIEPVYATRKLFDMKEVIYDKQWLANQKNNFDLYYMYRDLTREEDKVIFQEHKVRFDVTIIPPNTLGKEYIKTAGHFHPEAMKDFSFPEVYEVMHGEGIYVLQKDKINPLVMVMLLSMLQRQRL